MIEMIPVLVTTKHRGVFFGYADRNALDGNSVTLTDCRCCLYWSRDIGGFLGLASKGPSADCRIGTLAPLPVLLHDITSVSHVTEEAATKWMQA